ncbi:uncharacterized protein LOC133890576 isoform X1 [Phragmites australis]|uniref:uncharacterized protein LOC133890576 isoform X1 n=1 Tax=Phragmites australis TaxID=29695 RepID=UPI002D786B68|nr:uncharacterized protein LOC133890576 isoform X1 [Phragmites australis]
MLSSGEEEYSRTPKTSSNNNTTGSRAYFPHATVKKRLLSSKFRSGIDSTSSVSPPVAYLEVGFNIFHGEASMRLELVHSFLAKVGEIWPSPYVGSYFRSSAFLEMIADDTSGLPASGFDAGDVSIFSSFSYGEAMANRLSTLSDASPRWFWGVAPAEGPRLEIPRRVDGRIVLRLWCPSAVDITGDCARS